jgi:hypothetical protein
MYKIKWLYLLMKFSAMPRSPHCLIKNLPKDVVYGFNGFAKTSTDINLETQVGITNEKKNIGRP